MYSIGFPGIRHLVRSSVNETLAAVKAQASEDVDVDEIMARCFEKFEEQHPFYRKDANIFWLTAFIGCREDSLRESQEFKQLVRLIENGSELEQCQADSGCDPDNPGFICFFDIDKSHAVSR